MANLLCTVSCVHWAIPLNRDTPPIDDMILLIPGTDNGEFSVALGQTFSALLPWYRCLNPTKVDPGTDICFFTTLGQMARSKKKTLGQTFYCFTTLGQMAQSKKKTLGQTFTALLPWDRWLSPKRRPWDRHLLLYYPGTDGSVQPKQTLGTTDTSLQWRRGRSGFGRYTF